MAFLIPPDPKFASVYVCADGMGAIVAACEAALHPDTNFASSHMRAELALFLGEFAVDNHLKYFVVVDALSKDQTSIFDFDCVRVEVPRLNMMRQVTW